MRAWHRWRIPKLPATPSPAPFSVQALEYHEGLLADNEEFYGTLTLERIRRGEEFSATDYAAGSFQLKLARKAIARVFDEVDLLITPTLPQLPIRIEDALSSPAGRILLRNTMPFNLFGIPAISIPCGFSREGLPIGLQIIGRALGEIDVLALAHAYERRTDWHERTPSLT
jgi:aspartyl-tRNA(Asn)/glutamyl-tRNA(Gln) amidotransferase subunit A